MNRRFEISPHRSIDRQSLAALVLIAVGLAAVATWHLPAVSCKRRTLPHDRHRRWFMRALPKRDTTSWLPRLKSVGLSR